MEKWALHSLLAFAVKYRHITPPTEWRPEPVHAFICKLIQLAIQNNERIVITMPPQHGKSQIASVYAPIWYLWRNPTRNVCIVSYSSDLAEAKSLKARDLAREAIDPKLHPEAKSKKNWALTGANDASFRARGVGGGLTGHAIDFLIMDDLIKNHEEAESKATREKIWNYIESTISTRLSSKSAVVTILTRWHQDDYAARLHNRWGWPIYNIPAICEEEEGDLLGRKKGEVAAPVLKPKSMIDEAKRNLSSYVFSALYRGNPTTHEDARIRREWFKYYDASEIDSIKGRYNVYQTVDTSGTDSQKSDYFVCLTFAIVTKTIDGRVLEQQQDYDRAIRDNVELCKHIYVLDVLRQKFETTDHQEVLRLQREKWRPVKQYVEKDKFGLVIIQAAKKAGLPIDELIADKSKFLRSEQVSVYYRNGQVWHPTEEPWLEDFEEEITSFPVAKHDDQFDCISYAGIVAAKKKV